MRVSVVNGHVPMAPFQQGILTRIYTTLPALYAQLCSLTRPECQPVLATSTTQAVSTILLS